MQKYLFGKLTNKHIFLFLLFLYILLIVINIFNNNNNKTYLKEFFYSTPNDNKVDDINDKRVLLNYPPQENILSSSNKVNFDNLPVESNSSMIESTPIRLDYRELILPKEKQFGNNDYVRGLLDYDKLVKIMEDSCDLDCKKYLNSFEELLINPITKQKFTYRYELDYEYKVLNDKSWINRNNQYNPMESNTFNYNDIKSPIDDINILNKEFLDRINTRQESVLTKDQKILYGLIPFQIFKYKTRQIKYYQTQKDTQTSYTILVALFRNRDLYINMFYYTGLVKDGKPYLYDINFVGGNTTDNFLMTSFNSAEFDSGDNSQHLNKNFFNRDADPHIIDNDIESVFGTVFREQELNKLDNQYACFNIDSTLNNGTNYFLPFYNKNDCEATRDPYGRSKPIGVYDKPCKSNDECPFYKANGNYKNDFGKCLKTGYCEMPIGIYRIGYKYYDDSKKPMCYNCDSKRKEIFSDIDKCCNDQYTNIYKKTDKYPFLKTPDYAFENDGPDRLNDYTQNNCTRNPNTNITTCS